MRPRSLSYGPGDPKVARLHNVVREVTVTLVTSANVESGCRKTQDSMKTQRRTAIASENA